MKPIHVLHTAVILIYMLINTGANAQFRLSEQESRAIISSPDCRELLRMQTEFLGYIQTAIDKGSGLESIRKAALTGIQRNNNALFYELVFGNTRAGQDFIDRLASVKRRFLDQNRFIEANREAFTCSSCKKPVTEEANWFFDNYTGLAQNRAALISLESGISTGVAIPCGSYWNQLKLLACTALCSATTAGLATVLCGWGCWCSFCSTNSVLASLICEH